MNLVAPTAFVNPAIQRLDPPPIPTVVGWAGAYDGAAGPLIDLSQAVPGYAPHPDLLGWLAASAGRADRAGYGPIRGEPALIDAYIAETRALYGVDISADEVQITAGCNQAFFAVAMAIAGPGDDIVLLRPWYFNHRATLDMLDIGVTEVDTRAEDGFLPDPGRIARAIGPRTRAVVVISPNNPTGAVYPPDLLAEIFAICRSRGVRLILDETYRDFLSEPARPHGLFDQPGRDPWLVQLYSFSKSFCIPGHRLGVVLCNAALNDQIVKVMDNLQICAPKPPQYAVAEGLGHRLRPWREGNRAEIQRRAQAFREVIAGLDGWRIESIGAYFAYLRHPWRGRPAADIAQDLARRRGVVVLPGTCFGAGQEGFLRMSFANCGVEVIRQLGDRLR